MQYVKILGGFFMSNNEKVARFIFAHYGYDSFITVELYANAAAMGVKRSSISGVLTALKREGILINGNPRLTINDHIQKSWRMVKQFPG